MKDKEKTLLHMVDWNGASVTPRGLSGSSDAAWKGRWRKENPPRFAKRSFFC